MGLFILQTHVNTQNDNTHTESYMIYMFKLLQPAEINISCRNLESINLDTTETTPGMTD